MRGSRGAVLGGWAEACRVRGRVRASWRRIAAHGGAPLDLGWFVKGEKEKGRWPGASSFPRLAALGLISTSILTGWVGLDVVVSLLDGVG